MNDPETAVLGPTPPISMEGLAERVTAKILSTPAISQEYLYAIVRDALEEAVGLDRYCAGTVQNVFGLTAEDRVRDMMRLYRKRVTAKPGE